MTERTIELDRVRAAQRGSDEAFAMLTEPLRRELHIHCYRMLGTLDDADDALQETMIRAWKGIGEFKPDAPIRAWLYRIATNVCITMLTRRSRFDVVELDPTTPVVIAEKDEPVHLDPYPEHLLGGLDPESAVVRREGIELAFIAAVQLLPPRQRAALMLREVVGYSAAEVAEMLGATVASINSALQRARATLAAERQFGLVARSHTGDLADDERGLVRRFIEAWHAVDIAAIAAMLTEDALLTMPPQPERYIGPEAIAEFLSTVPARGRLDRLRLTPTRVNHQPALAVFEWNQATGHFRPHGVVVLALQNGRIASMTRFAHEALFGRLGLPDRVDDPDTLVLN